MSYLLSGAVEPGKEWLEGLRAAASESQLVDELTRILSGFGKISSVSFMSPSMENEGDERIFFVNFENSDAAMIAANELDCILYGFATLVVNVPRTAAMLSRRSQQNHLSATPADEDPARTAIEEA